MPTPVSTAKQCLNMEASHALDEAVAVARRRGHSQTTSLHAVSAFLSLSPSQLREACVRARNTALYPKIQLKALDFCLSVSLDRLPTSHARVCDHPPVSNSLMAAIKRSQANQRRQPDSLIMIKNQNQLLGHHHHHHQGQEVLGGSSTSSSGSVKVELQHLIVSILDDPIVSRVFNDAGFRSFDVKLAILRPFQGFFRYPSSVRGHQGLFLCNLDGYMDPGYRPFRSPFSGCWGNWDGDEDYRRIGEVIVRNKGRNPLLVGVCANEALRGFVEVLERRKENVLPFEVRGINVVSIEKDVLKFVSGSWGDEEMSLRFREVGLMVEHCLGPGLMVSFGNLRCFLGGQNGFGMDVLNCVVRKVTKLLEIHGNRVWLIGSAANDQNYMEFLSRFPSVDKDWDLQLLPITSFKSSMGESCLKSGLMGSFVPFGGFFPSPSDLKASFSSSCQNFTRCNVCNEKFEQEAAACSSRGFIASVIDQHDTALFPRQHVSELGTNNSLDGLKAKGGKMFVNATIAGLQRKWDNICQRLCHSQSSNPLLLRPSKKEDFLPKLLESRSETENLLPAVDNGQTSPSRVSVVTDLGLDLKSDANNYKTLFKALFDRVGRQSEALRTISNIVTHSWTSKSPLRGDIWLNFIGNDVFGKKKTALALADILYGSKNNFIHVDLCSNDGVLFYQKKVFGHQIVIGGSEATFRGKTVVDHITEELRKLPSCVVFLENVHSADPLAHRSLLQAFRSGRFSDSHGREVPNNNRIFVLTSKDTEDNSTFSFSEDKIARAKGLPLQIRVTPGENLSTQILLNKRKLNGTPAERTELCFDLDQVKRQQRCSIMPLDLNLPAQDIIEGSESWLEEFSDQGDKTLVKVVFEPFDYDALATKVLKSVHETFNKVIGSDCLLEIEPRVMDQILAAACLSEEGDKEVKDWINGVLSKGFAEAQKRYQLTSHSIVMIEAMPMEEQAPEAHLPLKIILN